MMEELRLLTYPVIESILEEYKKYLRGGNPKFLEESLIDSKAMARAKHNLLDFETNILQDIRQRMVRVIAREIPKVELKKPQVRESQPARPPTIFDGPSIFQPAPKVPAPTQVPKPKPKFEVVYVKPSQEEQERADKWAHQHICQMTADYLIQLLTKDYYKFEKLKELCRKEPKDITKKEYQLNILHFLKLLMHKVTVLHQRSDLPVFTLTTDQSKVQAGEQLIDHLKNNLQQPCKSALKNPDINSIDLKVIDSARETLKLIAKLAVKIRPDIQ